LNIELFFDSAFKPLSEKFLIVSRIQRDVTVTVPYRASCKVTVILVGFS